MGIILDVIILAVLALSIIFGYKKGLIGVAFNLCAFLLALILTWILYLPITNLIIEKTEIDDGIKNTIIEKGVIKEKEDEEQKQEHEQEKSVNEYIQKYVTEPTTKKANDFVEQTAKVVSEKLLSIGVAIILFISIRILLFFLKFIADAIAKLPIIKQFNKAGGLIYGIIRGLVIIYTSLAIIFFVMSINNSGMIAYMIDSSIISKYLYENNIILNIIF